MAEKFQNRYRIESNRLKNWDYGSNAPYFVSICTQNREHYFGNIENGKMQFSEIGKIAHKYWHEIPNHFPFVELDAFIAMPNHIHGIIIINKKMDDDCNGKMPKMGISTIDHPNVHTPNLGMHGINIIDNHAGDPSLKYGGTNNACCTDDECCTDDACCTDVACNVSSNTTNKNEKMAAISPKYGSLSTIIRSYKSAVTKNARKIHADFKWQSNYHDHIIRNDESFHRIQQYIINNPNKWEQDKFHE